jgi:hypothetical protein
VSFDNQPQHCGTMNARTPKKARRAPPPAVRERVAGVGDDVAHVTFIY